MNRRLFIQSTAAAAATPLLALEQVAERVDVNFAIGPWPFRDLPKLDGDSLKQRGITQAITGSLEALLTRDIAAVNARLAEACAKSAGLLLPAGTLHPLLPAWREDLRRCRDEHGMKVIRLHPNYHGYTLADPIFAEMLDAITEAGLAVQIVAQMEDQRTQHPLVQAAPVDLKPLHDLLKARPKARVMVLNANAAMITTALRGCTTLWLDCAMVEGVGGLENTLKAWQAEKLCLGTHAPFFYPESSLLKLVESELSGTLLTALTVDNARAFLS
ncbi:MAG: amidohydrolase family protein [Verrucomicrobiaceae bacterium]